MTATMSKPVTRIRSHIKWYNIPLSYLLPTSSIWYKYVCNTYMHTRNIMELSCEVQKYDWGKLGLESKVAYLIKSANPYYSVENTTPYAELWMGTHVNGPSKFKGTGVPLSDIITQNPNYLGCKVINYFGKLELPFLFKVLSVNKALSIQAHPSKLHAEQLHSQRPDLYKDDNHKPELAIALTPFEALCGFRPLSEIQEFVQNVPEITVILGIEVSKCLFESETEKSALARSFQALMTCEQELVSNQLQHILERFSNLNNKDREWQMAPLLERLHSQFPGDVGCFAIYFLNFLTLKPFEAIFLGPNEPHAYLYGDCIECMACSDNVVRAGLTPKYKDIATLCAMLNYQGTPAQEKLFQPTRENEYTCIYKPPVPDFAVIKFAITKLKSYTLSKRSSASILLTVEGAGDVGSIHLLSGTVIFIPANELVEIRNIISPLLMFQAIVNI